jgi:hypothetical protein
LEAALNFAWRAATSAFSSSAGDIRRLGGLLEVRRLLSCPQSEDIRLILFLGPKCRFCRTAHVNIMFLGLYLLFAGFVSG